MPSARLPGLSAERTRMAWRRTVLALTVCELLLFRLALNEGAPLVAGLAALTWAIFVVLAQRRIRAMRPDVPGRIGRIVPLAALACAFLGVLGMVLLTR